MERTENWIALLRKLDVHRSQRSLEIWRYHFPDKKTDKKNVTRMVAVIYMIKRFVPVSCFCESCEYVDGLHVVRGT